MKGDHLTRFYVWLADGREVGPLNFEEIQEYDEGAWVRAGVEGPWWPRVRWRDDGSLKGTLREHYVAWVWLLLAMPGVAYWLMPELVRAEFGLAWLVGMICAVFGVWVTPKEYPRFPKE